MTHRRDWAANSSPLCFVVGRPLRAVVKAGILHDQAAVGTVRLGVIADELHIIALGTAVTLVRRRFVDDVDTLVGNGTLVGRDSREAG